MATEVAVEQQLQLGQQVSAERVPAGLRVVIVTPERAVLDQPAAFVVLPMIDGELGVLPRHAPLIGRLGKGELRITEPGGTKKKMRVEGGFAQVRSNVVTVLTERVVMETPTREPDEMHS